MKKTDFSNVVFFPDKISMYKISKDNPLEDTETTVKYCESRKIRDLAVEMAETFVKKHLPDIFGHICSQCGNCCKRGEVAVKGSDIFEISMKLGISQEEFRDKYMESSATWNEYDGYLKLDGNVCPFLKLNPSGTYSCEIYDARPASCRNYIPCLWTCHKDVNYLIHYLDSLTFKKDSIVAVTCEKLVNGGFRSRGEKIRRTIPRDDDEIEDCLDKILEVFVNEGKKVNRIDSMILKACKMIDSFIENFANEREHPDFLNRVRDIRDVVNELDVMARDRSMSDENIDSLWEKYRRLEMIVHGEQCCESDGDEKRGGCLLKALFQKDGKAATSVYVFPGILMINYDNDGAGGSMPLLTAEVPGLLGAVRDMIETLVKIEDMDLQTALTSDTPPCYFCGICCSNYAVEIKPPDIIRLADNLGLSKQEFIDEYLNPPRFYWNNGNGILKKVEMEEGGRKFCRLLEKRDDGYYYCTVHLFKPEVCDGYKPTNRLCRISNNRDQWFRLPGNIRMIEIKSNGLIVNTSHTDLMGERGYALDWRNNHLLNDKISNIVEKLR